MQAQYFTGVINTANLMPVFSAQFYTSNLTGELLPYLIDNNSKYNLAWQANCTSTLNTTANNSCQAAPVYVGTAIMPTSNPDALFFTDYQQGGYTTNVQLFSGYLNAGIQSLQSEMLFASQVTGDLWSYNVEMTQSGMIGFGMYSQIMTASSSI